MNTVVSLFSLTAAQSLNTVLLCNWAETLDGHLQQLPPLLDVQILCEQDDKGRPVLPPRHPNPAALLTILPKHPFRLVANEVFDVLLFVRNLRYG